MNTVEIAATIVAIFFAIGIVVGIVGVIALSALRTRRSDRDQPRPGELPGPRDAERRERREGAGEPDDRDDRPWWDDRG